MGREIKKGWTDNLKSEILKAILKISEDPKWEKIVQNKKDLVDDPEYWNVKRAARILNIDLWDSFLKRLKTEPLNSRHWFDIMKNANDERIDQVISFALENIPIENIATGPRHLGAELG